MKKIYVLTNCDCIRIGHIHFKKPSGMNFIVSVSQLISHSRQALLEGIEVTELTYGEAECDYVMLNEYDAEIASECELKGHELLVASINENKDGPYICSGNILSAIGNFKRAIK